MPSNMINIYKLHYKSKLIKKTFIKFKSLKSFLFHHLYYTLAMCDINLCMTIFSVEVDIILWIERKQVWSWVRKNKI